MTSHDTFIESLPNETLTSILSPFPTQDLLSFAPINRRIYFLVARLIQQRLFQAAPLPDNKLILECYHPSDQLYTPYLACRYQGIVVPDGPPVNGEAPGLSDLRLLYASYKPVFAPENRTIKRARRRPTEAQPSDDVEDDTATQDINLDDGELFSQLCAVTNLVKEGPRGGLFISHVNIVDGVIRVFRKWLADMASKQGALQYDSDSILWVDKHNNVGIRFSVASTASGTMPLISGPDEDPPVHYKLVYEGMVFS
ncbi:hypothetical protein F53441_10944 [Fusarium austroafricanum]|uniref:F-box domain-containing protein n=1 Tax=Fusarium austroafricanum TaxID=2364996 RepID=A0A8H4K5I2_9HYPO|nr:hypothetical protein F53441_10944 [Fusarium austroafricanum]